MESDDHAAPESASEMICALEWVALAMDAARSVKEDEDSDCFRLDYAQIYTDKLSGL